MKITKNTIIFKDNFANNIVLEKMNNEGTIYLMRDLLPGYVSFNNKQLNNLNYDESDIKTFIEIWSKENIPEELLKDFDITLPHEEELFGENRFPILKKDWKKRIKVVIGENEEESLPYWTDTSIIQYNWHYIKYVSSKGTIGFSATNTYHHVALCFRKK